MAHDIKILVGTMTGTAELVADEIADVLEARGAATEVMPMDDLTPDALEPASGYLLCVSTYGQGDVPDNAQSFYAGLEADRPDLSRLRYGVFALGDTTYADTYCFGGKKFDALLKDLGAERIGERREHDASSGALPEEEAATWAEEWYARYRQACRDGG